MTQRDPFLHRLAAGGAAAPTSSAETNSRAAVSTPPTTLHVTSCTARTHTTPGLGQDTKPPSGASGATGRWSPLTQNGSTSTPPVAGRTWPANQYAGARLSAPPASARHGGPALTLPVNRAIQLAAVPALTNA